LFVQLVSKISNLCDPDPPTSQTDGRHAISIPRYALVHHAVKTFLKLHNIWRCFRHFFTEYTQRLIMKWRRVMLLMKLHLRATGCHLS